MLQHGKSNHLASWKGISMQQHPAIEHSLSRFKRRGIPTSLENEGGQLVFRLRNTQSATFKPDADPVRVSGVLDEIFFEGD